MRCKEEGIRMKEGRNELEKITVRKEGILTDTVDKNFVRSKKGRTYRYRYLPLRWIKNLLFTCRILDNYRDTYRRPVH